MENKKTQMIEVVKDYITKTLEVFKSDDSEIFKFLKICVLKKQFDQQLEVAKRSYEWIARKEVSRMGGIIREKDFQMIGEFGEEIEIDKAFEEGKMKIKIK